METVPINNDVSSRLQFGDCTDREITISGFVQNVRELSWGAFLILRMPNYLLQIVAARETIGEAVLHSILVEAFIRVRGHFKPAALKDKALSPSDIELHAAAIEVLSVPSEIPLPIDTSKKELVASTNTVLDLRPLSLRHPRERAVFRIQAAIFNQFGNYLTEIGFTRICSPKIVFSGAEGGANVFGLDYFGQRAYLAQSPQFYKQIMVGVFGRVFEEAPVFRAEKHNTSRHLNEYISLDLEMQIETSYLDIIQVEANILRSVFAHLRESCPNELRLLDVQLPTLDKITLVEFAEVHRIVYEEQGADYRNEDDLSPDEERYICDYAKRSWDADFVFVTHYPSVKRPFYAMDDPDREGLTLSFDLLFRGMEITTGGQRMHRYEDYISKMRSRGMEHDAYEPYLQTFRFGMPPHGGLGLGLERLTARLCGVENVKSCSLFPRDMERLVP